MRPPILTLHSSVHHQHAPEWEYLHGKKVPYFEMPQRIEHIRLALEDAGLVRLHTPTTLVSEQILAQVHDRGMIAYFKETSNNLEQILRDDFAVYAMEDQIKDDQYYYESVFPPHIDDGALLLEDRRKFYIRDSTSPIGQGTWDAVQASASLAFHAAHAVLNGEQHAYALCRPPGHHAGPDFAMGYCYVNNAAVAAQLMRERGRVAILDIDYHHGNGTQAIFWNDPDVLFISLHVDPSVDYPYYSGFSSERGGQAAPESVLNFPMPHGATEVEYLAALDQALHHIKMFGAESLIVSLGFDIYAGDPMARFALEVNSFEAIGSRIAHLALPTVYVQEGGYALDKLGEMAVLFFTGVLKAG